MNNFFKTASILSFIGAIGFFFVVAQTGKLAMLGMSLVMVCNGVSFWDKSTASEADISKKEENVEG